jgi:hypothetical protein
MEDFRWKTERNYYWNDIKMDLKDIRNESVYLVGVWNGSRADLKAVRRKKLLPVP